MDNVLITPRLGGMSDVYVEQTLPTLRHNLAAYVAGERDRMINRVQLTEEHA